MFLHVTDPFTANDAPDSMRTYVRIAERKLQHSKLMRWDSQRVDREDGRSLPGLDVERVRTFDAPEALGINFHEVRA